MVDRDVHVLRVLRRALLYFHGKNRHANAVQCYGSRTLPFLFYILRPKGIISILQVYYQYEVKNLNINDWSVFA
jgi:hypothetical protein